MTTITVNGKQHEVAASPDTALLYVLRNQLELNGPKFGCRRAGQSRPRLIFFFTSSEKT